MQNINKSNIEKGNFQSHVEYLMLKGKSTETLESMGGPETSKEAKEKVYDIISKENRYKNIIPLEDNVLYKILFEALSANRSIENQISIFSRQLSSKIAGVKVETGFIVGEVANNTYKKETPSIFDTA